MTDESKKAVIKPQDAVSKFHIEAERCVRGISLTVDGVIGIEDFSEEHVALKSHGGRVNVSGKRLKICVFESGAVEITGRVEDMRFGYGKN